MNTLWLENSVGIEVMGKLKYVIRGEKKLNSSMNIEEYTTQRKQLADWYDQLIVLAKKLNNDMAADQLVGSRELLMKDNFKIVVVGEFSRGKSTFINAMLGKPILPAKTNPTTTIINRISYGDSPLCTLHYRDSDKTKEISMEEFKAIIAVEFMEDSEEELQKKEGAIAELGRIAHAELRYPLDICKNGIELIDTPGTNDLDQVREEITFRFIPEADAAVMLLSAEQILARSELDFLKERILKNDIQKVFFAVNFKDRLDNHEDGERICNLAREQLKEFVDTPRIFLVSSRDALKRRRADKGETVKGSVVDTLEETGFVDFEAALSDYLMQEKLRSKLDKYSMRLLHLADRLIDQSIGLRRRSLGQSSADIEKQIQQLRPQLDRARNNSHRVFEQLKFSLSMAVEEITSTYRRGLERISRQAVMAIYSYNGELQGEAVARELEALTAPLQQENELTMDRTINERLNLEIAGVREKLQNIFKTENLSVHRELAIIDNNANVPKTVITIDDISHDEVHLISGGLIFGGLLLAVHAPFIAIPAAVFGGKYFIRQFENYRRADFSTKVSAQIRQRYEQIIPQQTEGLRRHLEGRFHSFSDRVEGMLDKQLASIEERLEQLLRDKQLVAMDEQQERDTLDGMESEIKIIQGLIKQA